MANAQGEGDLSANVPTSWYGKAPRFRICSRCESMSLCCLVDATVCSLVILLEDMVSSEEVLDLDDAGEIIHLLHGFGRSSQPVERNSEEREKERQR